MAQGEVLGRAALLARMLETRFGPLPDHALSRVRSANIAQLDAMGERLLTARSLENVFG